MYKRDGRGHRSMGLSIDGVQPSRSIASRGHRRRICPQASFLQRWVPGYSKLFPGDPIRARPSKPRRPANSTPNHNISNPRSPRNTPRHTERAAIRSAQYAQPHPTNSIRFRHASDSERVAWSAGLRINRDLHSPSATRGRRANRYAGSGGQVAPPLPGVLVCTRPTTGAFARIWSAVLTPPPALAAVQV